MPEQRTESVSDDLTGRPRARVVVSQWTCSVKTTDVTMGSSTHIGTIGATAVGLHYTLTSVLGRVLFAFLFSL